MPSLAKVIAACSAAEFACSAGGRSQGRQRGGGVLAAIQRVAADAEQLIDGAGCFRAQRCAAALHGTFERKALFLGADEIGGDLHAVQRRGGDFAAVGATVVCHLQRRRAPCV